MIKWHLISGNLFRDLSFFAFICVMIACTSSKKLIHTENHLVHYTDTAHIFKNGFSGILIKDLESGKIVYQRHANKYFVPASNIKILTLYACWKTLGDSIPALKYIETDSSFIFWGCGDPSFLHPDFVYSSTPTFLRSKKNKEVYYAGGNDLIKSYGHGWMWDDYNEAYQPELSRFPVYGNSLQLTVQDQHWRIVPKHSTFLFTDSKEFVKAKRHVDYNHFELPQPIPEKFNKQIIPIKNIADIAIDLLEDSLQMTIHNINMPLQEDVKTHYALPVDTFYRRMMLKSDNLFAEQLLLMCGQTLHSSFSIKSTIDTFVNVLFQPLAKPIKWVDGSGLSRYNMLTPSVVVDILERLYHEVPKESLYSWFNRTNLDDNGNENFVVFAKSGSMGQVYNLSGYLITKSGRKLVFSMMNNHYMSPTVEVKKGVESFLKKVVSSK